jgi:HK97 family phage portal protein
VRSGLRRLRNQRGSPVPYGPRSIGGSTGLFTPLMTSRIGNETFMRALAGNGTLWQIVHLLSSGTARAEWRLYRKNTDNRRRYSTGETGSDQRTEVLQHQALSVLNRPAMFSAAGRDLPAWTRFSLFEQSQQYLELTGESPWAVQYDPRATFPVGLWPVRPDRLEAVPDPEVFLKGWIYHGPTGERVPLQPHELIMEKLPNPFDPYRGLGPVQAVLVDLQAAAYSARWNLSFFMNDATPGGVIEVPNSLDDTEFDDFTARWRETHQGVNAAHRIAFLENGAKWVPNQMTLKDMDFANLRGVSREIIREAYGLHGAMLGLSEDINRANAQTAEEVFQSWKIVPRLDRRKETLNNLFLPLFGSPGQNVEFDYVSPVPANREQDNSELTAKANAAGILIQLGVFDPQDVLEVIGLPPMAAITTPEPAAPEPQPEPAPPPQPQAGWAPFVPRPPEDRPAAVNGHSLVETR